MSSSADVLASVQQVVDHIITTYSEPNLTPEDIQEVLLQSAIYSGVPAANSAFAIADRILKEDEGH